MNITVINIYIIKAIIKVIRQFFITGFTKYPLFNSTLIAL